MELARSCDLSSRRAPSHAVSSGTSGSDATPAFCWVGGSRSSAGAGGVFGAALGDAAAVGSGRGRAGAADGAAVRHAAVARHLLRRALVGALGRAEARPARLGVAEAFEHVFHGSHPFWFWSTTSISFAPRCVLVLGSISLCAAKARSLDTS